jgi:glycosyltransferase involved in cell wall biosynthesis
MKIAVISSHTKSLFWFRIDMMREFIKLGHSVIAIGSESELKWKTVFEKYEIKYKQLYTERNGINPFKDLRTFQELKKFMKNEKPDKVFVYQAKTIIYGCLSAKAIGITDVYPLIAGLGSIFRGNGFKNELIKITMKIGYRLACKASKKVFFQNEDDKNEFIKYKLIEKDKIVIINGSGVNLEQFVPKPLPEKITFLFIGRLIKDKGVVEYLEACKQIKIYNPNIKCLLIGPFDSNPSSLKQNELQYYIDKGIVEYFGEQIDVRPYLIECSTYVLPSYYEGIPKTILEAMAVGRSIITSDAPGCRETVIDGYNGYLVPVKDVNALVNKMKDFIEMPSINKLMAERSLKLVREKFDVKLINNSIMKTMNLI